MDTGVGTGVVGVLVGVGVVVTCRSDTETDSVITRQQSVRPHNTIVSHSR